MAEITWVKILTGIRDNKKIKLIRAMPEGDALFTIWIDLICMAGQVNDGGYIYITPELPYTDIDLAHELHRDIQLVKLAVATFARYQMIELDEQGIIFLPGFPEIQDIDGMERVRQLGAARVKKHRKLLSEKSTETKSGNVTLQETLRNVTVTEQIKIKIKNKSIRDIWKNVILINLQKAMKPANFNTWLADTECIGYLNETILIEVKEKYKAEHLRQFMKGRIENEICVATGMLLRPHFVLPGEIITPS